MGLLKNIFENKLEKKIGEEGLNWIFPLLVIIAPVDAFKNGII